MHSAPRRLLPCLVVLSFVACSRPKDPPIPACEGEGCVLAPETGATPADPPDTLGFIPLKGSCAALGAVEIERTKDYFDINDFPTRLRAKVSSLGYIRVRASDDFVGDDFSNVLGTIPSGTVFAAAGMFKRTNGIFYKVPVIDREGRRCLGLVSFSVVEPL
jgi:hypothetical protein